MEKSDYHAFLPAVFFIAVCVVVLIMVTLAAGFMEKEERNACEKLGGTFEVVDEVYSAALKRTVDIYGCVK